MSNISLNGFIIPDDKGKEGYEFRMGDIYVKQKNKSLKADSPNFSALSNNINFLVAAKHFMFYTTSEYSSRYNFMGIRFLKDYIEDLRLGQQVFKINLVAIFGDNVIIVKFSGCELAQSMLMPTPAGTVQSYEIKFASATVEKSAGASASR